MDADVVTRYHQIEVSVAIEVCHRGVFTADGLQYQLSFRGISVLSTPIDFGASRECLGLGLRIDRPVPCLLLLPAEIVEVADDQVQIAVGIQIRYLCSHRQLGGEVLLVLIAEALGPVPEDHYLIAGPGEEQIQIAIPVEVTRLVQPDIGKSEHEPIVHPIASWSSPE